MPQLLHDIGFYTPWLVAGLCFVGGIVAIVLMRRSPLRERHDRGTALRIGVVFGLLAGCVAGYVIGSIVGRWGGPGAFLAGVAIVGAPVFAIVLGASLSGYALLARLGTGARALAGAVAGPLVLGAIVAGGVGLTLDSKATLLADQQEAERAARMARSDGLQMTISDVAPTLRGDGTLAAVDMVVTVTATRPYVVNVDPAIGGPHFWLVPTGDVSGISLSYSVPPGGAVVYEAGTSTRYRLELRADEYSSLQPGAWTLSMSFSDGGLEYLVEAPVDLRTPPLR